MADDVDLGEFDDHQKTIERLVADQAADQDLRDHAREAHLFVDKRDGQWEPAVWSQNSDKPRYTFDMTTPIIDQIAGEMEQADFDIKVSPAGGDATKDIAQTLDGLIRNIENISNAKAVFNQASRMMVTAGMDGWEVVQEFVDSDSFDQDLIIKQVGNFLDRVWFDSSSEMQDRSDSRWGWKLTAFSIDEYEKRWPNGSGQSVTQDKRIQAYFNQPDTVIVGQFYYVKQINREIVLMSNGKTYKVDDDFNKVVDELELDGITETRRRKRKEDVVFIRQFDANDWLNDAEKTVFQFVPLIPIYGNFKINENKVIYSGAVEKAMDFQRVFNYAKSREIEEGSLAPRAKYWMTPAQAKDHQDTLSTLNTNSDPVQLYNPDSDVPPPAQQGGAVINQGLIAVSQSMQDGLQRSAGFVAPNMGEQINNQSGVAIEKLQNKGDTGTIKYFSAREIAICHTARIIIKAAPKVYDADGRVVRILKEDDSFDMVTLNDTVQDRQTGKPVILNDLSVGTYDVVCSAGPAFKNRQQETVSALVEIAQVDPSIIQLGADILLNNITAPGMDQLKVRKRQQLFQGGLIPFEQMTDEEKAQAEQAQNQEPQPDPNMVLAQAEATKAQADVLKAQNDQTRLHIEVKKVEQSGQKNEVDAAQKNLDIQLKIADSNTKAINMQADSLNKLMEAALNGALTPEMAAIIQAQIREVAEEQAVQ